MASTSQLRPELVCDVSAGWLVQHHHILFLYARYNEFRLTKVMVWLGVATSLFLFFVTIAFSNRMRAFLTIGLGSFVAT